MLRSILDSILFNYVRPKIGSDANNETLSRLVAFLNDAAGDGISLLRELTPALPTMINHDRQYVLQLP